MLNVKHSEFNKICGIYLITNTINGKRYVGSSKNIYYRIKGHLCDLRKQKHGNDYFQRSFNKYGESNWVSKCIEKCDEKELLIREEYYIDILKPEYNNILKPTRPALNAESLKKMSETLKKRYASGELKAYDQEHAHIPYYTYDMFGNFIQSYRNAVELSKVLGCIDKNIRQYNYDILKIRYCKGVFISKIKKDNIVEDVLNTIKYLNENKIKIFFPLNIYDKNGIFIKTIESHRGFEFYLSDLKTDFFRIFKKHSKIILTFAGYNLKNVYDL